MSAENDDIYHVTSEGSVEVDKRKTVSKYNASKHLRYANPPVECNNCPYRSEDTGGNGKCPKYIKDSVCVIRNDLENFLEQMDTRNTEDLKSLLDSLAKKSYVNVMIALAQSGWDGGIPDRNTRSEVNQFLKIISTANELNEKIEISETRVTDTSSAIDKIFQTVKLSRNKKDGEEDGKTD